MYIYTDDLFDDLMRMPVARRTAREESQERPQMLMATDIREVGEDVLLEVELPGFARDEIKLHLKDGYLTIEACRKQPEDVKYLRRERPAGRCSRTFFVGKALREEDFRARYEAGILTVTFPRRVQRAAEEKRYIPIEG